MKKNYNSPQDIRNNLGLIEKDVNRLLNDTALKENEKNIGFNIHKLKKGYIEFRYGGGRKVNPEIIKDKTQYYANIVKACYDKDYRKRDYLRKFPDYIMKMYEK